MNIGEIIKDDRENQNMSMNTLAKKADVSQSSLSRIEAGVNMPTFDVLERIIGALGNNLSDFFSSEEKPFSPSLNRLIQVSEKLTDAERELLTKLIEAMKE